MFFILQSYKFYGGTLRPAGSSMPPESATVAGRSKHGTIYV